MNKIKKPKTIDEIISLKIKKYLKVINDYYQGYLEWYFIVDTGHVEIKVFNQEKISTKKKMIHDSNNDKEEVDKFSVHEEDSVLGDLNSSLNEENLKNCDEDNIEIENLHEDYCN